MTLGEFLGWQAYAQEKNRTLANQAATPDAQRAVLPELGALGPGGVAHALRGR